MASGVALEQAFQHNEPGMSVVSLYVTYASGTPTLNRGKGVASITDTATGRLTITLADEYALFFGGFAVSLQAAGPGVEAHFRAEAVASSKTVEVGFYSSADGTTLTDPANGVWYIHLFLLTTNHPVVA